MSLSLPCGCCVLRLPLLRPVLFTRVMTRKKGKKRNRGRRRHRRSQEANARRRLQGGERLRRARGLLARRPVRWVLLGTAAKIFFNTDVPEALAPAVLRDAALDIARRPHGKPAQALRPEGTQRQAARQAPLVLPKVVSGVPAGHRLLDVQ